jgi:peptide/nickel transport system permease protein
MGVFDDAESSIPSLRDHYIVRNVRSGLSTVLRDRFMWVYFVFLAMVIVLAIAGPALAPYEPDERVRSHDGSLLTTEPPSLAHPLGTTDVGYDVLSRLLYGARPTLLAGLLGGILIEMLGTSIGVTAGYVGGRVEEVLMRFTDMVYGVPFIPFALVLLALVGLGYYTSILVIAAILWRGDARVFRSQVISIKERPYILAAKASGASTPYTIYKHILPNIAPMIILFFSLNVGYVILVQAGLAFLGVVDPFVPSWGVMLRNAYYSGVMTVAWWWVIPPGLMLAFTVVSTFMFGRRYENVAGQTSGDIQAEGA